ncbi:MAG: hypothetical protein ABI921_12475 [Panacibacter sp.]
MKNFIKQMFSDVDGEGSFKRFGMFVILLLIFITVIGVTFFHASFQAQIWEDLKFTFWIGLGFITSEKFTKRGMGDDKPGPA